MSTPTIPRSYGRLDGKVAIVTGSSRGIGRGIALELGARGASVTINYVSSSTAASSVVEELRTLGTGAIAVAADVTNPDAITSLFEQTVAAFGRVDIVVSNSGIESFDATEDLTPERFDSVFAVNARAQFFVATTAYRYLGAGGRVVLMSSVAARVMGVKNHALYAGSKSAVEGFVRSFATDFGPKGITVNAIAPGGVKTDMFEHAAINYIPGADKTWEAATIEKAMAGANPLGRCALPIDIARVVAFLVGEDSGWITGQVLLCTGGSSV